MKPIYGLAIVLAALTIGSTASARRAIDPRVLERAAVQVQEPQVGPSETPAAPPTTTSTVLAANAMWAATGVAVRAGDQLQIRAEGQWAAINPRQISANVSPFVGPDGYIRTAGAKGLLLESANRGALIGRIGENGTPFLVGSSYQGVAEGDGALFVTMNELPGQFDDNNGRLGITISVTPAPPPPPPVDVPLPAPERPEVGAKPPEAPAGAPPNNGGLPDIPLFAMVIAALGGLGALALIASALFSPRPRPRGGRDSNENRDPKAAPAVSARVATDGVRSQMLAISMRSGS